ncbi:MAG: AAA family ATPase [Polyangiaceae bacterium]
MSVASARVSELDLTWAQAERIAQRRNEPITTWHLLAAVASQPGPASDVLTDFKVSPERLRESAARVPPGHESADRAQRAIRAAIDFAQRTRVSAPTSIHLLTSMLGERSCHAYRVLQHAGIDVGRLRTAVMQVALGVVPPRRTDNVSAERHEALARAEGVLSNDSHARVEHHRAEVLHHHPESHRSDSGHHARARQQRGQTVRVIPDASPLTARSTMIPPTPPAQVTPPAESPRENVEPPPSVRPVPPTAIAVPLIPEMPAPRREKATARRPRGAAQRDVSRFVLDGATFPNLARYTTNLTLAMASDPPTVVGRSREVQQALDVLAKRSGNCPILVGPPGVGKTSTLRAIALATAQAPAGSLDDRIVVELDVNDLIAGTGTRGALLERVQAIRTEIASTKRRVVLAVEDVTRMFVEGVDEEAGTELRAALSRGDVPLIGTTTHEEFRRWIESDGSLSRCTAPVWVDEPNRNDTLEILRTAVPTLSAHHRVQFPDESLTAAISWTSRYMTGRAFPEKAMSVLDLAGARAHRRGLSDLPVDVLADVVAEQTDVPAERLLETDAKRMLSLEQTLASSVVGHGSCLSRIASFLRRSAAGIHGARPLGTFMLLGPTGVGKTETAKALARSLFGSTEAMTRIDMSEFSEPHAVARLIGAPPGYIGHEAGGQLTEAIRRRPYQVLLLDEIEKAHRDVLQTFLQVFDEGRLTDGRGRTVDFTQCVIVLTSNLGAGAVATKPTGRSIGFVSQRNNTGESQNERESTSQHPVIQAAREGLPPELYNRIDEVLVYEPLTRDDVREIARRLLRSLSDGLRKARGIELEMSPDVIDLLLARGGYEPELGARPMKRAIAKWVESPLAERLLMASIRAGDRLIVHVDNGDIRIEPRRAAEAG